MSINGELNSKRAILILSTSWNMNNSSINPRNKQQTNLPNKTDTSNDKIFGIVTLFRNHSSGSISQHLQVGQAA